ncbi:MAG: polyribitolphosphotransferase [Ruminococcaceae bacterium]|nr:polyribitolphosphotransferase [Oscillospiraceae bacterium]
MRFLVLKILITSLNILYYLFKPLKVQEKIVMISRQSNAVNDDFKLLGSELQKHVKVVYLCKTLDGGVNSSFLTKISYSLHMLRQMYHLATSKICILDSYSPVVSILNHKKDLKIIQLWHTVGKLKKFGWQIIDKSEGTSQLVASIMKMHKNYDIIYYSGEEYKEVLKEGFNADDNKFRKFSLPRIDLLNDEKYIESTRRQIFEKYPVLNEKINVLYAPTFRKNEKEFKKYFAKLIEAFDFQKFNLIVKLHPLTKTTVDDDRIFLCEEFSTFQMLTCTDKLVSDYSCIIYEAGIKGIPIYFYNYDFDNYETARGLAIDYNELPGFQEKDASKLVANLEKLYNYNYLQNFISKNVENTKNCTQIMAEDVLKILSNVQEKELLNEATSYKN